MNEKSAPTELVFTSLPTFNHKFAPTELQCRRHVLLVKAEILHNPLIRLTKIGLLSTVHQQNQD